MFLQLGFGVSRQVLDHVTEHVDITGQLGEITAGFEFNLCIEVDAAHQVRPVAQSQQRFQQFTPDFPEQQDQQNNFKCMQPDDIVCEADCNLAFGFYHAKQVKQQQDQNSKRQEQQAKAATFKEVSFFLIQSNKPGVEQVRLAQQ